MPLESGLAVSGLDLLLMSVAIKHRLRSPAGLAGASLVRMAWATPERGEGGLCWHRLPLPEGAGGTM